MPTSTATPTDISGFAGTTRPLRLNPTVSLRTPANPVRIISDSGQEFVETYRLGVTTPDNVERGWVPADQPDLWFVHNTPRGPYRHLDGTRVTSPLPFEQQV